MASQIQTQITLPPYVDINEEYGLYTIDLHSLAEDVEKTLREAEAIIRKGKPKIHEVKWIIERKIKELGVDAKYSFDESIDWNVVDIVNKIEIERVYDAVDTLEIGLKVGATVSFNVYADYVTVGDTVIYFKINKVEVDAIWWLCPSTSLKLST